MSKRNLIELSQENEIVCDNPKCDYKIPNKSKNPDKDCLKYLNVPCPKCGENLLTMEDYIQWRKMHNVIDWINKWFGWITIFMRKPKDGEYTIIETHVHNGIKISEKLPDE